MENYFNKLPQFIKITVRKYKIMSSTSSYTYKENNKTSPYAPHTFAADYALGILNKANVTFRKCKKD